MERKNVERKWRTEKGHGGGKEEMEEERMGGMGGKGGKGGRRKWKQAMVKEEGCKGKRWGNVPIGEICVVFEGKKWKSKD